MVYPHRPNSANNANPKYRAALRQEATRVMNGRERMRGRLYARVFWFHLRPTTQDADNIVKPILDSLKEVVFEDDLQIGECFVVRVDLSRHYTFVGEPNPEILPRLLRALSEEEHVLYLEIGEAREQIVSFEGNREKS